MVIDKARIASQQIDRERQLETGEVFTPEELIFHMFGKSSDIISDLNKTFLEPAAGDGNIIIAVIKFKLDRHGWTIPNATTVISNVYACEYMKDNRDTIVQRVIALLKDHDSWSDDMLPILEDRVAYCNTLDQNDVSDGRKFPNWLKPNTGLSWLEDL